MGGAQCRMGIDLLSAQGIHYAWLLIHLTTCTALCGCTWAMQAHPEARMACIDPFEMLYPQFLANRRAWEHNVAAAGGLVPVGGASEQQQVAAAPAAGGAAAGHASKVQLLQEPSSIALPKLLAARQQTTPGERCMCMPGLTRLTAPSAQQAPPKAALPSAPHEGGPCGPSRENLDQTLDCDDDFTPAVPAMWTTRCTNQTQHTPSSVPSQSKQRRWVHFAHALRLHSHIHSKTQAGGRPSTSSTLTVRTCGQMC